jgi:hypothetical protein
VQANPTNLLTAEMGRSAAVRYCVRLKSLQAFDRVMAGDASGLADDLGILLRHGEILAQTPLLISYLPAVACDALAISIVEESLALAQVPPDQLLRMQTLLARRETDDRLSRTLRGERAYLIAFYDWMRSSGGGGIQARLPGVRGWLLWDQAHGIRLYNQLVEAAEDRSKSDLVASVGSARASRFSLATITISSVLRSFDFENRRLSDERCARVAFAAERYRLDTGTWPAQLGDLVPAYIDAIPQDPFAPDEPLKLARTDERFIVYSVGPDRVDDQGEVKRGNEFTSPADSGFILLDPAARNQPPPPEALEEQ